MSIFSDTLSALIRQSGIASAADTVQKCEAYYKLLVEANKTTNLTRITGETDAARMHFFGAVELLKYFSIPKGSSVIDVGTGAGFPGIPLKIARPDINMTLIDSAGKKTAFVKNAAQILNIDVTVLAVRAEEAQNLREKFDIALSRAVAGLGVLVELCVPLIKPNGILCAFKGDKAKEELIEAEGAIKKLSCGLEAVHSLDTGNLIILKKLKPTPDIYPRRFSKIKKEPL